ncbi:ankyrin [Aureobasidium pullulans]|nr:ankyrin [Aureobasidium pullulans]
MVDPVGVVSLGIEVCKGMVKYYKSLKSCPQDVMNMCESLQRITGMFEAIHHKIDHAQLHGRDADQVGSCISQCSSAINSLQLKLHKFKESGSQDKAGRLKEIGHRLQYPFEKTTLLEIKVNISDIRADLLQAMVILHMDISLQSCQRMEEVGQQITQTLKPSIDGLQDAEKNRAAQEENNTILMWLDTLSPSKFTDTYNSSLKRRAGGTGAWILEDEVMKQWLDGTLPVLWCPGDPGSGKSVAMSIVVKHLLDRRLAKENIVVAYTYCVYNQQHQTATNFMASILAQFVRRSDKTITEVEECWKAYRETSEKPSSSEYIRLLKAMRGHFSKAFVLVDALDEFPDAERQSLIRDLNTLAPNIQILVTSRYVASIRSQLQDPKRMPIQARDEDVRIALAARIDNDRDNLERALKQDPTLRWTIIDAIIEKTKGMFLVAELHIKALSQEITLRDLREKLANLSEDITAAYEQTMDRINGQTTRQSQRARQVLCWLTHARRPLEAEELKQALAIRDTDKKYDKDGEISTDTLLSYCMGLVIKEKKHSGWLHPIHAPNSDVVRFVHLTAQEYFDKSAKRIGLRGHQDIAETCISTLLLSNFDLEACLTQTSGAELDEESVDSLETLQTTYPIVRYAAHHWGDHVRLALEADSTSSIVERVQQLLQKRSNFIFSTWITHAREEDYLPGRHPDLSAPHVLAEFGITSMLEDALETLQKVNVDVRDSRGRTPLHYACENGHYSTMSTLLELGADKNAVCRDENSPLDFALKSDNQKLIMELLDGSGEVESRRVLEIAIYRGHHAVTKVLLEKVQSEELGYGLVKAAVVGEESTVRLIVEAIDPLSDYRDHFSMALLSLTRRLSETPSKASFSMMDLLLESGADPNFDDHTSDWASTPLSCAAMSLDAVMYLIEQGALVNFRDHLGRTVLHSPHVNCETATFFIARGADVTNRDLVGSTPLHAAAAQDPRLLSLLLKHHAKVDAQDDHGMTALNALIKRKGHWDESDTTSLEYLLRYGASVDLEDDEGHIPLRYAVSHGKWTTCETLLMYGRMDRDRLFLEQLTNFYGSLHGYCQSCPLDEELAQRVERRKRFEAEIGDQLRSVDERQLHANKDLLTLNLPCQLGMHSIVRRFLEAGADFAPQQGSESFVMITLSFIRFCPLEEDCVATLELLLDHGLSIDASGERGTNLCMAIMHDLTKVVAMLLRRGANLDIGGSLGSPLMIAACGKHRQLLELLQKNRIDVNRAYTSTVDSLSYDFWLRPPGGEFPTGMTALHMCAASENSSESDLRLLISYGADLEAKNADGDTPLILAVRCGRLQTTAALLAAGADTSGSCLLTKQDRINGAYEVDFHKALCLVQEAHDQSKARIVHDISTAMLRAIWAYDWSAMKNVASTAYQDHKYGVVFVGFNIITIASAVFVGLCLAWFNGYLARRSAQL